MAPAAPRLPLAVLPDDGGVRRRPALDGRAPALVARARGAMLRLAATLREATGGADKIDAAFGEAIAAARDVVLALSPFRVDLTGGNVRPGSPVHTCFGVRVAPLDRAEQAAEIAAIVFRAVADLRHGFVDINDVATEVEALARLLGWLEVDPAGHGDGRPVAPGYPQRRPPGAARGADLRGYAPAGDSLERWVLAHHLYFLLNLFAAGAVRAAAGHLPDRPGEAADLLDEADAYVRGFTAAMLHAASVTSHCYQEVIRPTMHPPAVPAPLTGLFQTEHAAYRQAVADLLEASPETFTDLARSHRRLAESRERLLEADLLDIERHTILAATLVGSDHSLVQQERARQNAVSTLRLMRHRRAATYRPFTRFGDRVLLDDEEGA